MNNNSKKSVNNNKKRKLLISKKSIILSLLAAVFIAYGIFLCVKLLSNPTDTFIVEQGKIYKEETQNGYIIRKEHVVENENKERTNCSVKNRREKSC